MLRPSHQTQPCQDAKIVLNAWPYLPDGCILDISVNLCLKDEEVVEDSLMWTSVWCSAASSEPSTP